MVIYLKALILLPLLTATTVMASTQEAQEFLAKLQKNYQNTLQIQTFSLKYHFLNKQYRDQNYWDYQTPNRVMSQRMVEVDLVKKHFYDNDILYYTGGRLFDRAQFQNDKESFYYEKSNTVYGKAILNRGMGNFDRFIGFMAMNIDFLAVRSLLKESNIEENISYHQHKKPGKIILTHRVSDGDDNENIIEYEFSQSPLQLVSINKKSQGTRFVYDDYQTTRGLTFARSLNSYSNGASEPSYIKFIDQFDIIGQVDPEKLQLPKGYGPVIPKSDGILVAEEIAKDLYLVNDSGGWRNSLLKVNGDEIRVFGASGYPALAEKTIKLIHKQFPNKKISSVYVTHPHGYEIDGLNIFAEQGIEILADEYTVAAIKAYSGFAENINKFNFRTIEHGQIIDGAHFYVLENMHSKRQSFVHFKSSEIIYQSSFLHTAYDNTTPKVIPNYTRTFIDFVRSKNLKFKRIVGHYSNNNISVEMVNKTYDAHM